MTDVVLTRVAHKVLIGENPRSAIVAFIVAIAFTTCIIILDILLQPFSLLGWKGILIDPSWLLFFVGLLFITAVYSFTTGGILDCWLIVALPLSISFVTFLSVAPHIADPVPIWNWPAEYDYIPLIEMAIAGAVRWSLILGTAGFVVGKMMKLASILVINR